MNEFLFIEGETEASAVSGVVHELDPDPAFLIPPHLV